MKDIKNRILHISIAMMVVVTTLVASYTPIDWSYFGLSAVVMAILIWFQKRELKKTINDGDYNGLSLLKFEEQINIMLFKLDKISTSKIDEKYSNELLSTIDEVMPNIDEYRLLMINQFGVANYTQISIPFAKAERLINRGLSAAVDGYKMEAKKNISNSLNFLKLALVEINKVKVDNNG